MQIRKGLSSRVWPTRCRMAFFRTLYSCWFATDSYCSMIWAPLNRSLRQHTTICPSPCYSTTMRLNNLNNLNKNATGLVYRVIFYLYESVATTAAVGVLVADQNFAALIDPLHAPGWGSQSTAWWSTWCQLMWFFSKVLMASWCWIILNNMQWNYSKSLVGSEDNTQDASYVESGPVFSLHSSTSMSEIKYRISVHCSVQDSFLSFCHNAWCTMQILTNLTKVLPLTHYMLILSHNSLTNLNQLPLDHTLAVTLPFCQLYTKSIRSLALWKLPLLFILMIKENDSD